MLIATEGALWGSVKAHGFLPDTVIPAFARTSDDAGQFNVGHPSTSAQDGLCWVHAEIGERHSLPITKQKVSAGTRSDTGRDCRDAFLGLSKTCAKLGIAFWDYLGSRLAVLNHPDIPYLPQLIRHRCATA